MGQDDCNRESQTCLNTKGNFTCIDKVSKKNCPPGFKKNPYTHNCDDINECEETEGLCAENEECVNEPGGHTCILKPFPNSRLISSSNSFSPSSTSFTSVSSIYPLSPQHYSSITTVSSTTPRQPLTKEPFTPTTGKSFPPTTSSEIPLHYIRLQPKVPTVVSSTTKTPQRHFSFQTTTFYNPNVPNTFANSQPAPDINQKHLSASYPFQNTNFYPTRIYSVAPAKPVYNQSNSQPVVCPVGYEFSKQYNRCEGTKTNR